MTQPDERHPGKDPDGPDPVGEAMGAVGSGLFIITAGNDEETAGFLASFVQQVSFEPLMLMVAMNPARPAYELIKKTGELVVHVIGQEDRGKLVKRFWKGLGKQEILELPHGSTELGAPILQDAMAYLRCRLVDEWHGGDHAVLFGAVEEGRVLHGDRPKSYRRKSGRGY